MNTKILGTAIFFLGILAGHTVYGQTEKWSADGRVGASFAMDDFGSKAVRNTKSGLAKTGVAASVELKYLLLKNHGLLLSYRYAQHDFNTKLIETEFKNLLDPSATYNITNGKWKNVCFYGGFFNQFALNRAQTLFLTDHANFGVSFVSNPYLTTIVHQNSGTSMSKQESIIANSFSWLLGVSMKYVLNRVYGIARLDYSATNPEFKNVKIESSAGNYTYTFSQKIRTIDFSVGAGIYF